MITRIVKAKPPRKRDRVNQAATIAVPWIVKNKPANQIKRDRKWRDLMKEGMADEAPTQPIDAGG
jgi:hypothetical protein